MRTSGVSTRTFYAHFPRAEDCFASTYRAIVRAALRRISTPASADVPWEEVLRDRLRSLMELIAAEPKAAQLALLDCYDGGPVVQREISRAALAFEHIAATNLVTSSAPSRTPSALVSGIVAGVERVTRARVMDGRHAELPLMVDELAEWIAALPEAGWVAPVALARPMAASESVTLRISTFDRAGDDRGRILAAVLKLAASDGYQRLTVSRIRQVAGVSRRTFDTNFDGVSSSFLEAIEALMSKIIQRAARRARGPEPKVPLQEMVQALQAEIAHIPLLARVGLLEVASPGRLGVECRERLVTQLARELREPAATQALLANDASAAASWQMLARLVARHSPGELVPTEWSSTN